MRPVKVPAYYYPTTTVLVDDSLSFLDDLVYQLQDELAFKVFDHAHNALAYIKQIPSSNYITTRSFDLGQEGSGNPITHQTLCVDLTSIQEEIYNPKRFSEIAVVIVDYDMNDMQGLEFCRRLTGLPVKKILLANKRCEKQALAAFNEGIIDYVIPKHDSNVIELIRDTTKLLQQRYFEDISSDILTMLWHSALPFAHDPVFRRFFIDLCQQHQFVEFYLTELTGSFLLLDAQANPNLLVVKCYDDLSIHYEFAEDNGAPEDVLAEIRSGNKIPYAWQADHYFHTYTAEEWDAHLAPAEECRGKEIYYYALIQNTDDCPIDSKRIYSYQQYLAQLKDSRSQVDN